jgi:putative tricarboxylic transport membrane protein
MKRQPSAQTLVGVGVIAFAILVGYQTSRIPASPLYSKVGPNVFPYMVSAALLLLGVLLVVQSLQGVWGETDADTDTGPPDRTALAWLGGGLILNVVLIDFLGFIIASTILFVCTARAFGSKALVRDFIVAVVLALVAFLGFDKLLGISIGAGILEGIL